MKILTFLLLCVLKHSSGVIYRLNDSEYFRLPPLFRLENFDGCLQAPGDTYCYLDAKILPNSTNELSTLIQEYSASNFTHFDHTLIHWGVCVTHTCRQYYGNATLEQALEACVNATLYDIYQLQASLINETTYCTKFGESEPYDAGDVVVAAVFLALLLLNFCGTVYDLYFHTLQNYFVNRFLLCFSMKRNWQRLVMSSSEGPKSKTLKCLNGLKVLSTQLVLLGHTLFVGVIAIDNPQSAEKTYDTLYYQILYNGALIVQTFFVISGFLLAYNLLASEEKRCIDWHTLPRRIFRRYLRLTPAYAFVLAFICTWLRHLSTGPLWKPMVKTEIVDCRRNWWRHLLYIDNYKDHSQCMVQTWYISGDMQFTILGLAIFCLCRTARCRKMAIAVVFVIGLLTPAAHTFFQDLHAVLMPTPEAVRYFFVHDATFNHLYKRGHTNLICYVMGLALGMVMYNVHGEEFQKDKKHTLLYWGAVPAGLAFIMLGAIFYVDGIQIPLLVRAVYSSAIKVCFGACVCGLIAGTLLKLDTVVRGVLEWQGWTTLSSLSYCVYLIHLCVIRTVAANNTSLQHVSVYQLILDYCSVVGVSYILAVLCWLLVESPMAQTFDLALEEGKSTKKAVADQATLPGSQVQELACSVKTTL